MRRVGIVVFPGFQILDLAAVTLFELANRHAGRDGYQIALVSEHGGIVASSAGVGVVTEKFAEPRFHTLIVAGDLAIAEPSPALIEFVRQASVLSQRIASICTGAFVLATAGLLDHRRATTHWAKAQELQRRFPKVKVDGDRIFVVDGHIWTSAGMSACIDLALALIEADLGFEISRKVARQMVVFHRRSGGQSQFSALLELNPKSDRIRDALAYAKRNLRRTLSVEELAGVAHLSARQFTRAFRAETGQSPAKAIESLRVEVAKTMVEESGQSIDTVARETGFVDPERMRRAFIRKFGHPPQSIRRAANERVDRSDDHAA